MRKVICLSLLNSLFLFALHAQTIQDDFEGNGNISSCFGDACAVNTSFTNPHSVGINTSATVLRYHDTGGQYANVRFDAGRNLNLQTYHTFSLKVYVPSSGLTGTSPNQISLKLQDGSLGAPWSTQSEIIKPLVLNQWQTVTFNFATDPYINLDTSSLPPTQRLDFNRILLQLNGENNNNHVLAYIDDFFYYDSVPPAPVYNNLVWSDEFNGSGALDSNKWFHQTQLPLAGSWFNGEIQHYTNRTINSNQTNGVLNLVARRETFSDQGHTKQYTSARLNSKFAFTYGRVEIRAKMPTGAGTWPALWMLGKNINEAGAYWQTQGFGTTSWPACGEIDIMEHWGNNQNYVSSAIHTPSSSGSTVNVGGTTIPTVSTAFHTYTMIWTPNKIEFSIDSVVHYTYQPAVKNASTWPFDSAQYLLLNTAIQSSIAPNFTSSTMEVDYVRVYQQSPLSLNEASQEYKPSLYPNPVDGRLTIELNQMPDRIMEFQLYEMSGRLLKIISQRPAQNQVHIDQLGHLHKGMYLLTFSDGKQFYRLKFLKN